MKIKTNKRTNQYNINFIYIINVIGISLITLYSQESIFSFDDYEYKVIYSSVVKLIFIYFIFDFIKRITRLQKKDYIKILIILIFCIYYISSSINAMIMIFGIQLFLIFFLEKHKLYIYFYKILALICFLGLVGYTLFLLGNNLQFIRVEPMNKLKSIYKVIYLKSYFFVLISSYGEVLYRFQSVFGEPGTLGTLIGMLFLFDNNFNILKKQRLVLFISGILSLSTAFFIMLFFKFLSYPSNLRSKFKFFIILLIVIIISGKTLKSKNRDLYDRTFVKVFHAHKKNNRESDEAKVLLNQFMFTEKSILGTGKEFSEIYPNIDISSWKLIVYRKGYLALITLIIYFLYISKFISRKLYLKSTIIYFLASIYQRPDVLTPANLLILLTGLEYAELCYSERVKTIEKISHDNSINV